MNERKIVNLYRARQKKASRDTYNQFHQDPAFAIKKGVLTEIMPFVTRNNLTKKAKPR